MLYFLWILFDVAMALRMATITQAPKFFEIIVWAVAGLAVAVIAWVSDHRSTADSKREIAELKEKLVVGQAQLSGRVDMLGILGGENFRKLQAVTQTTTEPVKTVIEAASSKIEILEREVEELKKGQWRKINSVQRTKFLETLQNMKIENNFVEILVITGDAEAQSYAMQLSKLLRDAGFVCGSDGTTRDREFASFDNFGLLVLVKKADAPPHNAAWLIRGLRYSDIEYDITSERVVPHAREDYLALRIGPNRLRKNASKHDFGDE